VAQRNRQAGPADFGMQAFRRDMAMLASNSRRANATRWRVGRRPAARRRVVKSGLVPDIAGPICKEYDAS